MNGSIPPLYHRRGIFLQKISKKELAGRARILYLKKQIYGRKDRTMRKIMIILTAVMMAAYFYASAYAGSLASVNITGTYIMEGEKFTGEETNTFILDSSPGTPMPEGAEGEMVCVCSCQGGQIDFGMISYERPGKYEYTISRGPDQKEGVDTDKSLYRVAVFVYPDGQTAVVMTKDGIEGKVDKLEYTDIRGSMEDDTSEESTKRTLEPVKTGDDRELRAFMIPFILASLSFILCIMIICRRKWTDR